MACAGNQSGRCVLSFRPRSHGFFEYPRPAQASPRRPTARLADSPEKRRKRLEAARRGRLYAEYRLKRPGQFWSGAPLYGSGLRTGGDAWHTGHRPKRLPPRRAATKMHANRWLRRFGRELSSGRDRRRRRPRAGRRARSVRDRASAESGLARSGRLRCVGLPNRHARSRARATPQSPFVRAPGAGVDSRRRNRGDRRMAGTLRPGPGSARRCRAILFRRLEHRRDREDTGRGARYGANPLIASARASARNTRQLSPRVQYPNGRQNSMHSDFSMTAKSARAAILVPGVPLENIMSRSRALGNRDRLRTIVVCGAMALAAIGAAATGSKLYGGIQFWLSGSRGAIIIHSMAVMSPPLRGTTFASSRRRRPFRSFTRLVCRTAHASWHGVRGGRHPTSITLNISIRAVASTPS